MPRTIELETDRLCLRQWRQTDLDPFAALNADVEVMEFFPDLLSRAESDAMARRCQTLVAERGWGLWATELKATGEFVGFVGLHVPSAELPFSPCVEVGWRLARRFWGRGYATEGGRAALHVAFRCLGEKEVVSFTSVGNSRSRRVMERLGLRAADMFDHPGIPEGHPLRKHCLYRLSVEEHDARPPLAKVVMHSDVTLFLQSIPTRITTPMLPREQWFDRSFDFTIPVSRFPAILERLRGTPARLEERARELPTHVFTALHEGRWSIQENIGHLIDLESLWLRRAQQIFAGESELAPTDLANRRTHEANHNARRLDDLLAEFRDLRGQFVRLLASADTSILERTAIHPRLRTPMRLIDLAVFVAEHDDHHLAAITELAEQST